MRIGIILTGDYNWAGGVYYSLNLIKLLQTISLTKKLTVVVIINKTTPKELLNELKLKNIEIENIDKKSILYKIKCKIWEFLTTSNYRFTNDIGQLNLTLLYPLLTYKKYHSRLNCKCIYWLFDFQHKFLPELFSESELKKRETNFENIAKSEQMVIVSSYDSQKHFKEFYPKSNARVEVFNFVSLIERTKDKDSVNVKYKIPKNYFVVCNQFWAHKNHTVVLNSLKLLKEKNESFHVVFTGKYDDERNKNYVEKLFSFIKKNELRESVTFTNFISREEQILLIEKSKAVIQPSKFEGWSTVIEDAKALNKFLIVSDIPIHREQISKNILFFEQNDSSKLAEHLLSFNKNENAIINLDYQLHIDKAKLDLIRLFNI